MQQTPILRVDPSRKPQTLKPADLKQLKEKRQKPPVMDLQESVQRLRLAIKSWTRADIAQDAFADTQEGKGSLPIINMVLPRDGLPVTVEFDLAKTPAPDRNALADMLLGLSIAEYETALLQIVNCSQAAYAALQKQKEL